MNGLLDRIVIDLCISPGCSDELARELLDRMDRSAFARNLEKRVRQALNESQLNNIEAIIKH